MLLRIALSPQNSKAIAPPNALLSVRLAPSCVDNLYTNSVPRVQKCSERSGRSERSARAEQCSERKSRFGVFQQLAKRLCPLELYRDSVQGGTVSLKSYCMVVETHRAGTKQML